MKAAFLILCMGTVVCTTSAGTISLVADTTLPDPNDEITVWVHTDEPLLFMAIGIYVNGDATITSAMSEADCNDFGWENGWSSDPVIDPNGWVSLNGLCWAADANDIVGYFKFRYNSGQVAIYIDQENSLAGNWGSNFTFSTESLLFGELTLPPMQEPNEPTAVLIQCPPGTGGLRGWDQSLFSGAPERFEMASWYSDPNVIEISSDITTNQIWTSDKIYRITGRPVQVQALLIIEPGTMIIFDAMRSLVVNNGGTLISRGTPDKPIIYTCDYIYFDYPDYIGCYWQIMPYYGPDYWFAIYVDETASPATTVTYSFIEGAIVGIYTKNIRLDNPIENNYLFGNHVGIFESGPHLTDIRNNLCFYSDDSGIQVYLADPNSGVSDADTLLTIEQNTCDAWQDYGISIVGVSDVNEIPTVHLINNIVSESAVCGLELWGGPMWGLVINTGYYSNGANKNWDFEEYNPVEIAMEPNSFPFVGGTRIYDACFLAPDCAFIDTGTEYIEQTRLIGKTTNVNGLPDDGFVDLGFHYPNWNYAGGDFAETDFDENGVTDINDLIIFADYWLEPYQDPNDPNSTLHINYTDFALFAENWMKPQGAIDFAASINVSGEDGSIQVQVPDVGTSIYQYFLLVDGEFARELIDFEEDIFSQRVYMPWLSPGAHEARIVGVGESGIVCSTVIPFEIDNAIGPCIAPLTFERGEELPFHANCGLDVRVSAWTGGREVWSQTYPSGMVQGTVPAAVTDANDIEFLLFAPDGQFAMRGGAGASSVAAPVVSADDGSGDYTALMIRPYMKLNFGSGLADYVQEKLVEMGYKVKKLRCYNSSFKNVKKYIDKNTIKVLYYDGHGNYYIHPHTEIYRSVLGLDDCKIVSDKVSNYPPGQAPSWLEPLPPAIEASVRTWRELNLKDLKFAAFDACKAMRLKINGQGKLEDSTSQAYTYRSDLSMALLQRGEFVDQWVFGWAGDFVSGYGTPWQGFSITMWEELGKKEDLADAVSEAYGRAPSEVRNAYRLQGHDDPFDFKL